MERGGMSHDANDILRTHGADALREAIDSTPEDDDSHAPPINEPPPALSPNEFNRSTETRRQIAAAAVETTGRAIVVFPLVAFKDIRLDTTQRNYLIKHVLPRRGLAVIWGARKSYKSFIAYDMAMHVALGWSYRGYRVQQAPVVYIALEGREGQAARREAFAKYHDVTDAPLYLVTVPLDLVKQHRELIASIEAQLGDLRPGAVFIDTLNRSLVGSESKDEDMAQYLAAAGAIEQRFTCLVAIVHHCGIDQDRPRGHTSLPAAVDVQIRVDRIDDLQATVTVELAKDFREGTEIYCRLEAVEVGTDPDGDPITSLVVLSPEEAGAPPEQRKATRGLGPVQKNGLIALTECLAQTGADAPAAFGLPAGIKVVSLEEWRLELFRRDIIERGAGKNPASQWSRLKNKLFEKGHIGIRDDKVWRA
jgi:AAA domain-containing protein